VLQGVLQCVFQYVMQRIWKCRLSVSVIECILLLRCVLHCFVETSLFLRRVRGVRPVCVAVCFAACAAVHEQQLPRVVSVAVCVAVGVDAFAVLHDGTNDKAVSLKIFLFLICTRHSNLRDYF